MKDPTVTATDRAALVLLVSNGGRVGYKDITPNTATRLRKHGLALITQHVPYEHVITDLGRLVERFNYSAVYQEIAQNPNHPEWKFLKEE